MDDASGVVEPVRPVDAEVGQQAVHRAAGAEQEQERDGDRDGAGHGREVERGPEEPTPLHRTPPHEHGEGERESRLRRYDEEHVPEVVAQRDAEVLRDEATPDEEVRVVLEADETDVGGERAAPTAPVRDAHPGGHRHRQRQEQPEDHQHRRREHPSRGRLPRGPAGTRHHETSSAASRLVWTLDRMACGSLDGRLSSCALRSATTGATPLALGMVTAASACSTKADSSGNSSA